MSLQKVATRAFKATQQYASRKRGRPHFKGKGQFDSVEGKTNKQGVRWKNGHVHQQGLEIPVLLDPIDKHGIQAHALDCPVKYVRIVRRRTKGKDCFYAQLVLKGKPRQRYGAGNGTVGLGIDPSSIAVVYRDGAFLEAFCAELRSKRKEIRRLQRAMARSLRTVDPDAYDADGTIKKGVVLRKSKGYLKRQVQLQELDRKIAALGYPLNLMTHQYTFFLPSKILWGRRTQI